jgi:hypothetical protein
MATGRAYCSALLLKGDYMDWKSLTSKAAPVVVNVRVELSYDRVIDVPIGTLTYGDWLGVDAELPEPPVPRTLAGVGGTKQPNRDDVKYREELARVMEERNYRRLALALEKGGTVIPGITPGEKAAAIKAEMDAGVANALMVFIAGAAMQGKASVEAAADTFQR